MEFFQQIFEYKFLTNAVVASLLIGIVCGTVGSYVVFRRLVFMSGGITHASFGGIGMAYYFGLNPLLGAAIFALLSAAGVEEASARSKMREDSMIGLFWSVGMAVGIIFIHLTPGYAPNLMSFLFGNILTVTKTEILMLGGLSIVVVLLFVTMIRPIIFVAFDREFAKTQGVPVRFISHLMMAVIALTIVVSLRVVGIMLLISLLTMPTLIANALVSNYKKIMIWAIVVAIAANFTGLYMSYLLDVPASAVTVFILTVALIVAKLLPLWGKRITTGR